jgi:hypothetical protein
VRTLTALGAGLVSLALAAGLAACGNPVDAVTGGDPIQSYCKALNADRQAFAQMISDGSPTALMTQLPMLRGLAAEAPSDLTDEWQAFVRPIEGLQAALVDAGLKPSDYKDGNPPSGLSVAQRKAISDAADQLSAQPTVDGASGIDQEARDVCKINLGM